MIQISRERLGKTVWRLLSDERKRGVLSAKLDFFFGYFLFIKEKKVTYSKV
jgi:hypothetical protein